MQYCLKRRDRQRQQTLEGRFLEAGTKNNNSLKAFFVGLPQKSSQFLFSAMNRIRIDLYVCHVVVVYGGKKDKRKVDLNTYTLLHR